MQVIWHGGCKIMEPVLLLMILESVIDSVAYACSKLKPIVMDSPIIMWVCVGSYWSALMGFRPIAAKEMLENRSCVITIPSFLFVFYFSLMLASLGLD